MEVKYALMGSRVLALGNFWKYRCAIWCIWWHQVVRSGRKNQCFSFALLKVGRNSRSLPYGFCF